MKKNILIITILIILAILAGVFLQKRLKNEEQKEQVKGDIISTLANVDDVSVLLQESFPLSAKVLMTGNYNDGCSSAGAKDVFFEEDSNTFYVEFFVTKPLDLMCTQVIVPFSESVTLNINGFKKGSYNVIVNGVESSFVLDFDNIAEDNIGKS